MKLGLKKKQSKLFSKAKRMLAEQEHDEEDDASFEREETTAEDDDSWMATDPAVQKEKLRQSRESSGDRPPETWIGDGETKVFRFRDNDPIATIFRYNVPVKGKFEKYTQPSQSQPDLFADELNLRPQFCAVYEVIDRTGYRSNKGPNAGKSVKNVPRFFAVSGKLHDQIQMLKANAGNLTKYDVKVTRTGSSKQTAYMLFADKRIPMSEADLRLPRLSKDFKKYYAPKSVETQRAIVARASKSAQ